MDHFDKTTTATTTTLSKPYHSPSEDSKPREEYRYEHDPSNTSASWLSAWVLAACCMLYDYCRRVTLP